jgi:hypothetical protein
MRFNLRWLLLFTAFCAILYALIGFGDRLVRYVEREHIRQVILEGADPEPYKQHRLGNFYFTDEEIDALVAERHQRPNEAANSQNGSKYRWKRTVVGQALSLTVAVSKTVRPRP